MRRVASIGLFAVCLILALQANFAVGQVSAATNVGFSQTIRPLLCTVDIIAVGPTTYVNLSPSQCIHSPEARQLLADTKATILLNQ